MRRAIEGGILAEHEAAVRDNRDPKAAMGKRMATVNHALRQLAVVFEEECRTNRWSFFPGVISELGALVGAATDEEAVRETMRREARRWHSSFVRKSKELVAQLRADYEVRGEAEPCLLFGALCGALSYQAG